MILSLFVIAVIAYLAMTTKNNLPSYIQVCKNGALRDRRSNLFISPKGYIA